MDTRHPQINPSVAGGAESFVPRRTRHAPTGIAPAAGTAPEWAPQLRRLDRWSLASETAARIAHDVGTPLNVILARASMSALDRELSDAEQGNSQVIVAQAKKILAMLEHFLEQLEQPAVDCAPVHLHGLFTDHIAGAWSGAVRIDVAKDLVARVDSAVVMQIVTELVSNAEGAAPRAEQAQAAGPASTSVRIAVEAARVKVMNPSDPYATPGDYLRIVVRDDGEGFDPADAETLLHRRSRPRGERTRGLGLVACASAARRHNGFLEVHSAPGAGTAATVYLTEGPEQ
jgi:signal transduction histidine kinase